MTDVMFVDPGIENFLAVSIVIGDGPSNTPHGCCSLKVLLPVGQVSKLCFDRGMKRRFLQWSFATEVVEIVFMQPHAVKFPSDPARQFPVLRSFSIRFHGV